MDDTGSIDDRPETTPANISVNVSGFATEQEAKDFGYLVINAAKIISRYIDIESLDGITIAGDYKQALLDLNRGYETNFKLAPSEEYGVGVAMTPSVIRDGV